MTASLHFDLLLNYLCVLILRAMLQMYSITTLLSAFKTAHLASTLLPIGVALVLFDSEWRFTSPERGSDLACL